MVILMSKKYTKKYIPYTLIKTLSFLFVIYFIILGIVSPEDEITKEMFMKALNISLYVGIGYLILDILLIYLEYRFISYEINKNDVVLKKGIIYKSKKIVPYNKIHSASIRRGLLMQIFGISQLCIDSGCAGTSKNDEIVIYESKEKIIELEKLIKKNIKLGTNNIENDNENIEDEKDNQTLVDYKFNFVNILKKTFISFGFAFVSFLAILAIFILLAILIPLGEYEVILFALPIVFIIYIGITLLVFIVYLLKYFNYQVFDDGKNINISFGLINKNNYLVPKKRIKAIIIMQDAVMKKFNYASLNVELIGMNDGQNDNGNEKNSDYNMLIPICKLDEINTFLENHLSEYKMKEMIHTPREKTYYFFSEIPTIVLISLFLPFIIAFITTTICLIILFALLMIYLIIATFCYLKMSNQGLAYDDDIVCFSNGSIVKRTYIVKWSNIVSINRKTTPLREKYRLITIGFDYYNTPGENSVEVEMLDKEVFEEIESRLKLHK